MTSKKWISLEINPDNSGWLKWQNRPDLSSEKMCLLKEHLEACVERMEASMQEEPEDQFLQQMKKKQQLLFLKKREVANENFVNNPLQEYLLGGSSSTEGLKNSEKSSNRGTKSFFIHFSF
jgi:hypothetical protein